MAPRILIVDDEPGIRDALALLLEDHDYEAATAPGGEEALARLRREECAAVLCDVAMPGMDGITLVGELHRAWPDLPVIMVTAHGELETAVRAVRAGAYDYLTKPVDPERLLLTVARAIEWHRLRRDYERLQSDLGAATELLGQSPPMRQLREEIARAAPSDSRILILGEHGTGKELVARAIHEQSRRRERPFVKVNSAAIPRDLVESELFGHEAGAFTGAIKLRRGRFEQAQGGTLFLDEIADMALDAQAKLLRVLSTGELERVGGTTPVPVDVRLVCATNRDLAEEISDGSFRPDLYHRIAVIPVRVPPLRARGDDILVLARGFLARFSAGYREHPPALDRGAEDRLQQHPWPGNVRELQNLMERIAIMHAGVSVTAEQMSDYLREPVWHPAPDRAGAELRAGAESRAGAETRVAAPTARPVPPDRHRPAADSTSAPDPTSAGGSAPAGSSLAGEWKARQREEERKLLEGTLVDAGWNVTLAAERLGIDRASLHRKMRRFGIHRPGRRDEGEPA